MKKKLLVIGIVLVSNYLIAQTPVPKFPLYEMFTSSTCGPCAPANANLTPIFLDSNNDGEFAVVKYQMSWPGLGDPYFTNEGSARKNVYSVSSVPSLFVNANNYNPSSYSQSDMDANKSEITYMSIEAIHSIEPISQQVHIQVEITAHQDYTDPIHRVYIMITESRTENNVGTNGETEFFDVMKKVLPTSTGDFIMGTLPMDTILTYDIDYQFQGSYRLPVDANDAINHNNEHSVENFENLKVVVFVQSMAVGREVYQAANSIKVTPEIADGAFPNYLFTSVEQINDVDNFQVIVVPNPTANGAVLKFYTAESSKIILQVVNGFGQVIDVVYEGHANQGDNRIDLDFTNYSKGVYFVKLQIDGQQSVQKVIVK
ncbi:MAG: T9SS type A sorting domain-containing protein [Flavobacteriales bacterium]|nr:T9SS type A sorting domain-containing protein [Flavobacteriales bacterium]